MFNSLAHLIQAWAAILAIGHLNQANVVASISKSRDSKADAMLYKTKHSSGFHWVFENRSYCGENR